MRAPLSPQSPGSLALVAVLLAGCASGNAVKRSANATPPPGWLKDSPVVAGRVYAIGHSGPTFWPQDALNQAGEDARGKLAIALQSKMEVLTKRAESGDGSSTHLDLIKSATDLVVQNSRIEATWVDSAGEVDEANSVFALAYMELEGASKGHHVALETGRQEGVPAWLDRLPEQSGRIYAHGYSGPTFHTEDAVEYAGDDAVENLARALRSHVQAYQLLVETNANTSLDEFSRTERPEEQFKELVKKKAKLETTWVDNTGLRAGFPAGSVWTLAYIEVGSTKGGYQQVQNDDTGPALTRTGEAGAEPSPAGHKDGAHKDGAHKETAKADATKGEPKAPAHAGIIPASAHSPSTPAAPPRATPREASGKLAPYPSEGERCKPGYDSSGGWCLPPGSE